MISSVSPGVNWREKPVFLPLYHSIPEKDNTAVTSVTNRPALRPSSLPHQITHLKYSYTEKKTLS